MPKFTSGSSNSFWTKQEKKESPFLLKYNDPKLERMINPNNENFRIIFPKVRDKLLPIRTSEKI